MHYSDYHFILIWAALVLDWWIGDPDYIWRYVPHPVILFGKLIHGLDVQLNQPHYADKLRKQYGIVTCVILCAIAILLGTLIAQAGAMIELLAAFTLFASKSLVDHLKAVLTPLKTHNVIQGRIALSHIVGRDTATMDESDIARAGIESAAENLSDGVIAPLFWYLIGGLPLLMLYKMINTADSMIGYKNDRYMDFGYGCAKMDDLLNYIPARLTAWLIILVSLGKAKAARQAMLALKRDGSKHDSPNAGMPEAAIAGALSIQLGGTRSYGGTQHQAPEIFPEGARTLGYAHLRAAIIMIYKIMTVIIILFSMAAFIAFAGLML
ncbi:MAG: adenosylcobinamide-phosphate synthase CbiB [Alphaproteobacteria bacterium]